MIGYGLSLQQAEALLKMGPQACDFFEHCAMFWFLREGLIPPDHHMPSCYLCQRGEV